MDNNIRFYRQQIDGLTQALLAKKAGISERQLQNLENNRAKPKHSTVQRLAIALNVTVEKFYPLPKGRNEKEAKQ